MFQNPRPPAPTRWLPAMAAALLWALAAGSAALWWLHLPRQQAAPVASAGDAPTAPADQGSALAARALGHATAVAASPDAQRRFQLIGVIASATGQGSALLSIDGQPPKAYVQGQTVAEGWQLQSVARHAVRLSSGQGGVGLDLSLPGADARSGRD